MNYEVRSQKHNGPPGLPYTHVIQFYGLSFSLVHISVKQTQKMSLIKSRHGFKEGRGETKVAELISVMFSYGINDRMT